MLCQIKAHSRESGEDEVLNNANYQEFLKLSKKQQEYIQMKYETGLQDKEISKQISVHVTTISRWKQTAEFMNGLKGYTADQLEKAAPKAMNRMVELLYAKSDLVSFQAAKDILDRTGYTPIDKKEIELTGGVEFVDSIPKED